MKKRPAPKRSYPPAFERVFPWIIGVLLIAVVVLVVVIVSIPLGLFPDG